MNRDITAIVNEDQLDHINTTVPKGRALKNIHRHFNDYNLIKIYLHSAPIEGIYLMWDRTRDTSPSGYDVFIEELNKAKLEHLLLKG